MRKHLLILALVSSISFLKAQIVNIPDAKFKAVLLAYTPTIDLNNEKEIQVNEALVVKKLNLSYNFFTNLTGIEAFTALDTLHCSQTNLSNLDVSKNIALKFLDCSYNHSIVYTNPETGEEFQTSPLTTLDISKNTSLVNLYCNNNELRTLDVSKNKALTFLECNNNQINTLDVSNNTALTFLECSNNQLNTLDVSNNTALTFLGCINNHITTLDVKYNINLKHLFCSNNQLTTLDLSKNTAFWTLHCNSNQISTICINPTQETFSWQKDATAQYSTTCTTTALEDTYISKSKKLHRIITPLGQEVKPEQANAGIFIYQYTDGSTRKIMKLE